MGRTVITWRDMENYTAQHPSKGFSLEGGAKVDDYTTRILKYIPIEVVTVITVLDGIIRSGATPAQLTPALWALFIFGCCVTPLYLWRMQRVRMIRQLIISTGAFVAWSIALGGPFAQSDWYHAWIGSVVLVAYTFLIPLIGGFPTRAYSSTMPKE